MSRLLAITLLVLWTSPARAQKPDVSGLEASGNKHYELAEYDAAIVDFKEAFRISDEPGFLFNIAQAYRVKGDCREAATFYKNYLRRMPAAPNAQRVQERIAEMEKCAATQPAPTTAPTTAPTPTTPTPPVPVEHPPPPVDHGRPWMKWAGLGALGLGAVGLGLGVKFALDGSAANDDLAKQCESACTSVQALAIERDGKAANRNALIASAAGGVAVVAGVVLLVLSRSGGVADSEPTASVSFAHGGVTASFGGRF